MVWANHRHRTYNGGAKKKTPWNAKKKYVSRILRRIAVLEAKWDAVPPGKWQRDDRNAISGRLEDEKGRLYPPLGTRVRHDNG